MAVNKRAKLGCVLHGSGRPIIRTFPEAASQTFKEGDLVFRSGGYLTICGSDPALILGIAMQDAHNTTAGLYNDDVLIIDGLTWILMQVYHATPANDKIEAADLGKLYEIAVASNCWYVDKGYTSANRVVVQQFFDPLGTIEGLVYCSVLPANREVS